MLRQQPVIPGPPRPGTTWHDFCTPFFVKKCYNFLKATNSLRGQMNHASHREGWLQPATKSVRSGVTPTAPVDSEDCWCSSKMCSMPYGGEHLSNNLSAVRDFINPFAAWSLDFRWWGSGMQGWLQRKAFRGSLVSNLNASSLCWPCVRPHHGSLNTTCNPYKHAGF